MTEIADRFLVDFESHEICDLKSKIPSKGVKVEPRVMHVLKILIEHSPNVVTREQLIEEVWDNYGGADDALNQAISHLRKHLDDNDRENRLIETVVKRGYRFNGPVIAKSKRQSKTVGPQWMLFLVIILAFIAFLIWMFKEEEAYAPLPDFILFQWVYVI